MAAQGLNSTFRSSPSEGPVSRVAAVASPLAGLAFDPGVMGLANRILNKEGGQPLYFSGGATSTEDVNSDLSYTFRTFMPAAKGSGPGIVTPGAAAHALGTTTAINTLQGAVAAHNAYGRFSKAGQIGDKEGMIEGGIDVVRGVSQSVGGALYAGVRVTQGTASYLNVDMTVQATTKLGKAAFGFGVAGNSAFAVVYAAMAAWGGYLLWKDVSFKGKLEEQGAKSLLEQFEFLKKETMVNFTELLQKRKTLPLSEQALFRQELIEDARACLEKLYPSDPQAGMLEDTILMNLGFALHVTKAQATKVAEFSRATSDGCAELVQKAARRGLSERLQSLDPAVQAAAETEFNGLKGKITAANTKSTVIHAALLVIGALGVALTVLSFLTPPMWIALGVTIALVGLMLLIDAYCMHGGLNSGAPGIHDKKYLLATGSLIFASIVLAIALIGFAHPIVLLLPLIYAVMSLGLCYRNYGKLEERAMKWKDDHPTLADFQARIARMPPNLSGSCTPTALALFKKLPKSDRMAIRAKLSPEERPRTYEPLRITDFTAPNAQLMVKGMKKTVKLFWESGDAERAMQMQSIYDRLRTGTHAGRVKLDPVAFDALSDAIFYVQERQGSQAGLLAAVSQVIVEKERTAAGE